MPANKTSDHANVYGIKDCHGPIIRRIGRPKCVVTGSVREGIAWRKSDIDEYLCKGGWAVEQENMYMSVTEELKRDYEEAAALWQSYDKQLATFRSQVKNDITSLEAGARRTTEAAAKMNSAYAAVFAQLNGPEMLSAIANAERLATAMQALATLQSHKLTFAVIDAKGTDSR